KEGTMRITGKNQGIQEGIKPLDNPDTPVDLAKMSDKELEEYLLRQRVDYQKVRRLLELIFNDLKVKTVLHLPGDIVEAKAVQKDGRRTVTESFDGNAFLLAMKKFVMMDAAELKKLAKTKNEKDLLALMSPFGTLGEPDVTVNNLGDPQFD